MRPNERDRSQESTSAEVFVCTHGGLFAGGVPRVPHRGQRCR